MDAIPRPFGLLAELTYHCPLHCPYCSNPTQFPKAGNPLTTGEWKRVLREAAEIGVLHVLFSGGEPLAYPNLTGLVAAARSAGLYTNLITSGIGFTAAKGLALRDAGLDHIQISFQADAAPLADQIAGRKAHASKLAAAHRARELNLPLTVNVVLHRWNIERIGDMIALAEELGAQRLELANTQFYGWAFRNKRLLLPTREQVQGAEQVARQAQERLRNKMQVLFVPSDYYAERPKPCMNGWGQRFLTVNPVGEVLPCPTASEIRSLMFDNVRRNSLKWIWSHSEAFRRFRGTAWMPEPCRSCAWKEHDFGGCRCQAYLLTGGAAHTDPACELAPHRDRITQLFNDMAEPISHSERSASQTANPLLVY